MIRYMTLNELTALLMIVAIEDLEIEPWADTFYRISFRPIF